MQIFFSRSSFLGHLALIGFFLFGLSACKSSSDGGSPAPSNPSQTNLKGTVVDQDNMPLVGVAITVGSATAVSDNNGIFTLSSLAVTDNRCVIKAEKAGYFTGIRAFTPGATSSNTIVTLMSRGTPTDISATSGGSISKNGLKIELPAQAFTLNGTSVTGNVQAYARYIAPADPNIGNLMPGGDFAGVSTAGAAQTLVSYGAVQVNLESGGQEVQLAAGKTATVRFPAGTSTEPTIPLWHLDEATGKWMQEGTATLTGTEYVGTVSHFSTWNLDIGRGQAGVLGNVVGCDGKPLTFLKIRVGQKIVYTDRDGDFFVGIPANQSYSIEAGWDNQYTTLGTVPALPEGERRKIGQLATCPPTIIGKLVGCNGAAGDADIQVFNAAGQMIGAANPGADGTFSIFGSAGQAVIIRVTKLNGEVINQPASFPATGAQPKDIGSTDVCVATQPNGRLEMGFNLTGDGMSNKRYDLYYNQLYDAIPEAFKDKNSNTLTILLVRPVTSGEAVSATFEVPGAKVGTYVLGTNSAGVISLTKGTTSTTYAVTDSTSMSLTITQYDSIGGRIKGTFSGNMGKYIPPTTIINRPVLTITNGTFDVKRSADQ